MKRIFLSTIIFSLFSCSETEINESNRKTQNDSNDSTIVADSSTKTKNENLKEIKNTKEILNEKPEKIDKKTLIMGIWTYTKAGRVRGKMKFTKYGTWYVQKKNKSSWKKEGSYRLNNDCSSISLNEGRHSIKCKLKTYTKNKVVIVVDKNDATDNIILTK